MITERLIFQARTREAGAVVAKCKEAQPMLENLGIVPGGYTQTSIAAGLIG
jgi:hypothetical protein